MISRARLASTIPLAPRGQGRGRIGSLKEFSDQQLNERVMPPPYMGPSASRLRLIYGSMQHTLDIYGKMVVYLRLNGIVPPASRGV
jgi:hypothetical protein